MREAAGLYQKRILLVEDNPDHLELISRSLCDLGFNGVLTAESLAEAKVKLKETPPDLVLCDWRLPDGEGVDLLLRHEGNPKWPLIVMTSHGNEERAVEAMKKGALDYVVKSSENIKNMGGFALRALREWEHVAQMKAALMEKEALQKQLLQSQKLEAIGTMAGGIAHDFNNILSGILGYVDLALMELDESSRAAQKIQDIKKASLRAVQLIRQILSFSQVSSQEFYPIPLEPVVREVAQLMRGALPPSVKMVVEIVPGVPDVLTDGTHIHQILTNLCTNGAQAMERGGLLTIGLSTARVTDSEKIHGSLLEPGLYVLLSVSDTGSGIEPSLLDKIFDPFFTTKSVGKGTGLGLATVHGLVRGSQGRIFVESQVGKGTTFRVYFPAFDSKTAPKEPETQIQEGLNQRIMIVDDEPMLVDLLSIGLKSFGYLVWGTTHSQTALEKFLSQPESFDLLITDQTMPGLSGLELIAKVREVREDLPVILCSGYHDMVKNWGTNERNLFFIKKPVLIHDMVKLVESCVEKPRI